jgi:outer membrane lipopolysaccharide assembly protein LptE/RlpB
VIGVRAVAVVALLALAGCGYRLVRYERTLGDLGSVAIPTLENESYEAGVENMVSNALRREFLRRGALSLSDDPARADLVLAGSILPVHTSGRSFSSVTLVLEYEITLSLALTATRSDGTEVPLDPNALRESERYLASADVEATRKNREEALRRVSGLLAGRIHDALAEALTP